MNICLVTKVWESGTAWYVRELARGFLMQQDGAVALVAPSFRPESLEIDTPDRRFIRWKTAREANEKGLFARYLSKLSRIFDNAINVLRLRRQFRVFLFSIPDPVISPLLFLLLRMTGAQVVLTVHDPFPHGAKRHDRILRWRLKALYECPSILLTLTEAGKRTLCLEFGISPAKITVVPHPAYGPCVEEPTLGRERLLVFGSIRPNKNVLETILAVKRIRKTRPNLLLHIAGNPGGGNEQYWAECVRAMQDDPTGFLVDARYISESEVAEIVRNSDAFVLPYRDFESQSGVAVLAGLSGRPVVATSMGGFLELRQHGLVLFPIAEPAAADEIADAIQEWLNEPQARLHELTYKGRSQLGEYLSAERVAALIGDAIARRSQAKARQKGVRELEPKASRH